MQQAQETIAYITSQHTKYHLTPAVMITMDYMLAKIWQKTEHLFPTDGDIHKYNSGKHGSSSKHQKQNQQKQSNETQKQTQAEMIKSLTRMSRFYT